jgi:hypothetical protein
MVPCRAKVAGKHDGKYYCAVHHPDNVTRRKAKQQDRYELSREIDRAKSSQKGYENRVLRQVRADAGFAIIKKTGRLLVAADKRLAALEKRRG